MCFPDSGILKNHVQAKIFLQQQQQVISEVTFASALAFEAHRHTTVQEATTEMTRSDAHNADTFPVENSNIIIHMLKVNLMNFNVLKRK